MASGGEVQTRSKRWSLDTLDDGLDFILAESEKTEQEELELQKLIQDYLIVF